MTSDPAFPLIKFRDFVVTMPPRGQLCFLDLNNGGSVTPGEPPEGQAGLVLFHAVSGVCGLMPTGVSVLKSDRPILSLSVLHHGDELNVGRVPRRLFEIMRLVLPEGHALLRRRCPFCKDEFRVGDVVVRCPYCNEGYCERCWTDLHGRSCCTRNCSFSPGPFLAYDAPAAGGVTEIPPHRD